MVTTDRTWSIDEKDAGEALIVDLATSVAPTDAASAAAHTIEREWGHGYRIGLAGRERLSTLPDAALPTDVEQDPVVYLWIVVARDGARFLIATDAFGNVIREVGS